MKSQIQASIDETLTNLRTTIAILNNLAKFKDKQQNNNALIVLELSIERIEALQKAEAAYENSKISHR